MKLLTHVAGLLALTVMATDVRAAGASLPPYTPLVVKPQVCATRGKLPATEANNGRFLTEDRALVQAGRYGCGNPQMVVPGFYVNTNGLGELALQNTIAWNLAVERLTPNYTTPLAPGTMSVTVTPGDYFVFSGPLPIILGAYEQAKVQVGQVTAGGTNYYLSATGTPGPGDITYNASVAQPTQVPAIGTWGTTNRFSSPNVATSALIGLPTRNSVAVCLLGDSIENSRDDFGGDANGFHGYAERMLATADANGKPFPFINLSQSGDKVADFASGLSPARLSMLQFCSHVYDNKGTNDLTEAGITLATMQARYTAEWAAEKAYGVKVYQGLIEPRTTSNVAVTSLTSVGTLVTATVPDTSMLRTGEYISITGALPATYDTVGTPYYNTAGQYNIGFPITVVDATHFTYTVASAPASSPATGTILYNDGAASLVNQTPITNFASGGLRDQVNTWIRTQVGTLIDGIIDVNPCVESQSVHGVFANVQALGANPVTTGAVGLPYGMTSDPGIHLTDNGHLVATACAAPVAQTFAVN